MARHRARYCRQCQERSADLVQAIARALLRHCDRRGAHDCHPYLARAAGTRAGEARMIDISQLGLLKGKKALVTGIANDQSIAWGCAKTFRAFGADVAVTYLNDKAKSYVVPLAKEIGSPIFMP